MAYQTPFIHPSADVSPKATISSGVKIWHQAQVREGAFIGVNCIIGKGAYIDFDVSIGMNSKIQNGVYVYHGVTIEDGVFLGPGVILTNDRIPRAINPDGSQKKEADWQINPTLIKRGASIGAGAIVISSLTIGEFAMVGAGAVVTRDVPSHGLVYGNPARFRGYVCRCGQSLIEAQDNNCWFCSVCSSSYQL